MLKQVHSQNPLFTTKTFYLYLINDITEIALKVALNTINLTLCQYLIMMVYWELKIDWLIDFWCLTPLSAIFQLYHGDQFEWWKRPEYPERTTNHGQATGKLCHLQMRDECTLFCNLQSRSRTLATLVIGLYELLGNPTN